MRTVDDVTDTHTERSLDAISSSSRDSSGDSSSDSSGDSRTDEALLAAVRDEVLAYGVRRATATSIAQRAGVSRVTVYRRGGGIKQLLLDALVGEFRSAVEEVTSRVVAQEAPRDGRALVTAVAVGMVRTLSQAPLVAALLEHDPEMLLPYIVDRHGRSQRLMLDSMSATIAGGIEDGSIRRADPDLLAVVLLHALTPFVVGTRVVTAEHDLTEVLAEVRHLVDGYLAPPTT
jgi:AcrR family transcriptional regulator